MVYNVKITNNDLNSNKVCVVSYWLFLLGQVEHKHSGGFYNNVLSVSRLGYRTPFEHCSIGKNLVNKHD